ncbi:MAG TPA: hypothetical protein DCS43_07765, partial [Verrucomicrobia bacterium]|nr:hypothetical protein [Verrucomicrobiota bacterium]
TNSIIDLASPDRVSSNTTEFVQISGVWYRESRSYTFPEDNGATALLTGSQRQRLTGLGTNSELGTLSSELISIDLRGNQTVQQTHIDRENAVMVGLVSTPTSINDQTQITKNGLLISQTSATGEITTYGYDALGRRIATTDPRTGTSITHYNTKGQVDWVEDAATNRTAFAYDPATGQRIATTDALSNTTHQAYSVEGQLIATWGATYPVYYEYDEFNRMSAMYTYRGTNEINSVSDFNSLLSAFDKTSWQYDQATGLLTNKLYSDGNGTSYTYTPDGKLATRTWARGVVTTYSYDTCCGALTNITYSDNTPSVSYTYDRLGRQVTITDAQGTRTNVYDATTLALVEEQLPDGTVLERTQDTYGRASGISLGDDYEVNYAYDGYGRFHSVSSAYSVVEYSYLEGSLLISGYSIVGQAPLPVLSVAKTYEPNRNLITDIENMSGTNLVSTFSYQNDAVGRRTKRIDNASVTNAFGYNVRSEVIEALMGTNTYGYAYDPIGNREQASLNTVTNFYAANALNQYTNISNGAVIEPTYDADGNMLTFNGWTFTWNGENRLITASNTITVINNAYDYMGRRITKTTKNQAQGTTNQTQFVYDGWAMIREQSATTTNTYVYGLDLSGSMQGAGTIGGILSADLNGTTAFYCYDANGNVTDLVDTNGNSVAHYEYGPFGGTITQTGSLADDNPFRFSSKYLDGEVNLYYYGYRFYSPETGRWVSRDPIGERGGWNIYAFPKNNPIDSWDLLGRDNPGSGGQNAPALPPDDDSDEFLDWYNAQSDMSWMNELNDRKCPCKLKRVCTMRIVGKGYDQSLVVTYAWALPDNVDQSKWNELSDPIGSFVERFHPGAAIEVRSKPTANGHTNQCTYDDQGDLITTPPAMGTVDRRQGGHWSDDVLPVIWAAGLDGKWEIGTGPLSTGRIQDNATGPYLMMYYEKRPCLSDNCGS